MSDTDIESGQKWQSELSKQLDECKFGIVCVTPENQAKPWLNFEAGALSKTLGSVTFVCPYLYEMEPEGLTGPLSQFQSRKADKEGTRQLVCNISSRLDENDKLSQAQVEKAFDRWWEELEMSFSNCPKTQKALPTRSQEELLTEILENTRALRRELIDQESIRASKEIIKNLARDDQEILERYPDRWLKPEFPCSFSWRELKSVRKVSFSFKTVYVLSREGYTFQRLKLPIGQ
jgi:hypothetical protein